MSISDNWCRDLGEKGPGIGCSDFSQAQTIRAVHASSVAKTFRVRSRSSPALTRDFKRALVTIVPDDELAEPLTLVLNWAADWENGRPAAR